MNIFKYFLILLMAFATYGCSPTGDTTTFYLVRHAEKANDGTKDPPLNEAGEKRAHSLADMLSDVSFDAIYASDFKRTKSTAMPVAEIMDKVITLYDPRKLEDFVKHLYQNHKGQKILVVGHSNTTPKLANLIIGEEKYQQLDESEYDKIFIIHSNKQGEGNSSVLKMESE